MAKEFIKGNWYRVLYNDKSFIRYSNTKRMSRISSFADSYLRIHYNEVIKNGVYELEDSYWANDDFERHALENPVDLSEIQEYLPHFHENYFSNLNDLSYEKPLIKLLNNIT